MLVLTRKQIMESFSMREAIDACKESLKLYSEEKAVVPLRTNINIGKQSGQSLYMPAYVEGEQEALGVKIVSVYPKNIEKNIPSVPATMVTLDAETGIVSAILDGTYLTQLRTGAVQGAATELLSRKDSKIGALIGTGGQAECQLWAMLTVRELEEIKIFDIDFERAKVFALEMEEKYKVKMIPAQTAEECVRGADIITSVTTSKCPTFSADWVKEGAHINGVGAYTKEMCEIPKEIIKAADIIVFDTTNGVMQEAGDFIQPIESSYLDVSHYDGELGELILGKIQGRKTGSEITIFKTVGSAVLDVYVADQIVRRAKAKKVGQEINF